MATNEILPFGDTASGADILTQSAYNGDSQRSIGHQAGGDARRELVNKTLKQVSKVASGVAQYIASNQASDVTDTVTTSTMATMFANALTASIDARTQSGKTVYADRYATLALAIAAAGAYGKVILPANATISAGNIDLTSYEGITIEGTGVNSVISNTNDTAPCFYMTTTNGAFKEGPKFKNFRIISKYPVRLNTTAYNPPGTSGTMQGYIMRSSFEGMFFETTAGTHGTAIEGSILFDSQIRYCIFASPFDIGIYLTGSDISEITGNRFVQSLDCHIKLVSTFTFGSQNAIYHNDILDTGNGSTALIKTSDRFGIIRDNYIEHTNINTPILTTAISIDAGINGSSPIAMSITGNRFDVTSSSMTYWLRFNSVPGTLEIRANTIPAASPPAASWPVAATYWYNVYTRRNFYVQEQAYLNAPFHTLYGKVWDQKYAYYFAPHLPGHSTSDVSINTICRNGAFVIDNNSLIHHFDSVLVDGGRTGFTATISIIAKADVNNNHLVVMERNSITQPGGAHYVDLTLSDKKAKYTYLTSTAISDNFEILLINSGAGDIEVYAIIVEYG